MDFADLNPDKVILMSKDHDRDWDVNPPHVVVDGNCWLYECSYYLARGLALGRDHGAGFNDFIKRFMDRVCYVKKLGFKATIIFDGRRLPAKQCTDASRREIRTKNVRIAAELEAAGQGETDAAHDVYNKSFVVTNALMHRVYTQLIKGGDHALIAPYTRTKELRVVTLR